MYKLEIKDKGLKEALRRAGNQRMLFDVFRIVVGNALVKIKDRIQQKGIKGAKYTSLSYKKERRKQGLNTSFVDLTFTGQMMNAFQLIVQGALKIGLGWQNAEMAKRAIFNEKRYGTVFEPTKEEINELEKELEVELKKRLRV